MSQKIESRQFTQAPSQNSPPGSYYHLTGQGKLFIPPAAFFKKIYLATERGVGETMLSVNNSSQLKLWSDSFKNTCK